MLSNNLSWDKACSNFQEITFIHMIHVIFKFFVLMNAAAKLCAKFFLLHLTFLFFLPLLFIIVVIFSIVTISSFLEGVLKLS